MTYSLFDLNEHVQRAVALNFTEPVWISAEIAHCALSRGHYYISLVQKSDESDETLAQAEAILWASDFRRLLRTPDLNLPDLLQAGLTLRMQVRVDFHIKFGYRLHIQDVDAAYTLGLLEIQRRQTLQRLQTDGLLERNKQLQLKPVLQRIAVVSSSTAAGLADFMDQLENNAFDYLIETVLFDVAVQGKNAEIEIIEAFERIAQAKYAFDCVVVIRGGGSKLDLSVFDGYEMARAAAHLNLPVLTGIGHETDDSVLDKVAFMALKTPTAVAEAIIQHNLFFENRLMQTAQQIQLAAQWRIKGLEVALTQQEKWLHLISDRKLTQTREQLAYIEQQLPVLASWHIQRLKQNLVQTEKLLHSLSPQTILKRGYSMTLKGGKIIANPDSLLDGDTITTRLSSGEIISVVKK